MRYATGRYVSAVTLTLAVTLGLVEAHAGTGAQIVDGFTKVVSVKGLSQTYADYRGRFPTALAFNRKAQHVEWLTAPVPSLRDTIFVFTGSSHKTGDARLFVNDQPAVVFSFYPAAQSSQNITSTIWFGPQCRMLFAYHSYRNGHAGVYYLLVPAALLKKGEPARLRVQPLTGPNDAWFGLSKRADTREYESKHDANENGVSDLEDAVSLLTTAALETPDEHEQPLGAVIKARVVVPETIAREITVTGRLRATPDHEFTEIFGTVRYISSAAPVGKPRPKTIHVPQNATRTAGSRGRVPAVFVYRNNDPGKFTCIVNFLVKDKTGPVLEMQRAVKMGADIPRLIEHPSHVKVRSGFTSPYQLRVRPDKATPHIPWAKPYVAGPVKAVFFMPLANTGRVVSELIQRMDLRAFALHTGHYGAMVRSRQEEIDKFLKRHADAQLLVVAFPRTWGYMPPTTRQYIMQRVARGMGLVIVWATESRCPLVARKNEGELKLRRIESKSLDGLFFTSPHFKDVAVFRDYEKADDLATFYRLGKGRIVLLHAQNGTQYEKAWYGKRRNAGIIPAYLPTRPDEGEAWEYHYVTAIRAMLWAAGRTPSVLVTRIARGQDSSSLTVILQNNGGPLDVNVHVAIKNAYAEEEANLSKSLALPSGKRTVTIPLPALAGGDHWANVIIRSAGKSVGWGAAKFNVPSTVQVKEARFDKEYYEVNQPAKLTVRLSSKDARKVTCAASVVDTFSRVLARTSQTASLRDGADHSLSFTFRLGQPLARLHTVWLTIEENGRVLARRAEEFTIVRPDTGMDYKVKIWGGAGAYQDYHYVGFLFDQLRAHGIDTVQIGGNRGDEFINPHLIRGEFRAGVLHNLQVDAINMGCVLNGGYPKVDELVRPRCVNNPKTQKEFVRQIDYWVRMARRFGPVTYLLGDEMHYAYRPRTGVPYSWCMCEYCLPKFRRYLREQYGTLARLNAQWNTRYTAWDKVMPMKWGDAVGRSNYGPWLDHRIFSENTYLDARCFFGKAFRERDPHSRTGTSGCRHPTIWLVENWPRCMAAGTLTGFSPYWFMDDESLWMHQFYTGKEKLRMQPWIGYSFTDCPELVQAGPFYGFNGTGIYTVSWFFDSNFSPKNKMLNLAPHLREQKQGIVPLLMNADRPPGPVATHFAERAGVMISSIQGKGVYRDSLSAAVKGYGLWPRVLSSSEIENGALLKQKRKVLLTGYLPAVSDRELDQLERFVRQGGVLLVCYRFGIFDQHGKPRDLSRLERLTGVKIVNPAWRANDLIEQSRSTAIVPRADGQFGKLSRLCLSTYVRSKEKGLHHLKVLEGTVEATFKKGPLAGQPAIVTRRYGAGAVYYVNGFMAATSGRVNSVIKGKLRWWRASAHRIVRTILETAGVQPDIKPMRPDGWYEGLIASRFQQGGADYLCFASERSSGEYKTEDVTFTFPVKRHFYEARSGRYFGKTDAITLPVGRPTQYVFAAMPYKVSGLTARDVSVKRGDRAAIAFALTKSGKAPWADHVLHVTVQDPAGAERTEYDRNLLVTRGKGAFHVPIALNDPAGKWTVKAFDRVSGMSARASITIGED